MTAPIAALMLAVTAGCSYSIPTAHRLAVMPSHQAKARGAPSDTATTNKSGRGKAPSPKPAGGEAPKEPSAATKDKPPGDARAKAGPTQALVIECVAGCAGLPEGRGRRDITFRVRDTTGKAVPAATVTVSADSGRVFPAQTHTDAGGRVTVAWEGFARHGRPILVSVSAEAGDAAAGSLLLELSTVSLDARDAAIIEPLAERNRIRWYANAVIPDPLEFRVTLPGMTNDDELAAACENTRVEFRASLKKSVADSTADTVSARFEQAMPDGRGHCIVSTLWRLADVPGTQVLKAKLLDERPRARGTQQLATTHAEVEAVAHNFGHFILGLALPGGGKGRNPGDTAEKTVVPIVGADFSLLFNTDLCAETCRLVFDHLRFLVATRVNQPGSEALFGLQVSPLIEGPSAERPPLLVGGGVWIGPKGTHGWPFVSLSYDATSLFTNVIGLLGLAKAGS